MMTKAYQNTLFEYPIRANVSIVHVRISAKK